MVVTDLEEVEIRKKQQEFGLTEEQCYNVVENIKQFFRFSDAELEFHEYILNFLEVKK